MNSVKLTPEEIFKLDSIICDISYDFDELTDTWTNYYIILSDANIETLEQAIPDFSYSNRHALFKAIRTEIFNRKMKGYIDD